MSLLRLLTAGRSLVGLKKIEKRYHLPGGKALPKFGSKKNPFRATVLPEKVEPGRGGTCGDKASPGAEGITGGSEDRKAEPLSESEHDETPGSRPQSGCVTPGGQTPETPGHVAEKRRGSGLKAFLLWGRAKRARARSGPAGKPLVQGELSLEAVKVVRNDLSESDLEIVHARRPQAATDPGVPAPELSSAAPPLPGWGAAAGRLLGLGKS